ncbi:MAG: response regulator transcription factor [Methylomonas sp.]|jgi:DNA-binding NarL/FixJ family response regulator|uniref:response regulator transcription factor n=1 Tax=Methylomonas sp. TaxID=418 RepID=UPI0025F0CFFE|nr:response regulator transcription factor [Methylomonas sp.]MCK9604826.1 response regulator transcription factor [Methylomonas sp.]
MMESTVNNGTVLIVDDTPGNLALLSDTLSEAHYRVLVAIDGSAALEQIQYIKPDIILLDVMMPGIDGFETCNRLKADPATAAIPVLFMTGLSELDDLLRGFGEGALDYIVKPIRPAEVLARIEVHLSQTRNLRRAEQLLSSGEFAAMTVDGTGRIVWMTPTAEAWLADFNVQQRLQIACGVMDFLPGKLLTRFQAWRQRLDQANAESGEECLAPGFIASICACEHPDEYMLLLQRDGNNAEWDLQALRGKLKLTFREAEILMWIARGKTNKEIGIILNTSPRTVNKHLEHIFEKLGVSTRAAAVAMVLERG